MALLARMASSIGGGLAYLPACFQAVNARAFRLFLVTRQSGRKGLQGRKMPDKVELLKQNQAGEDHASEALSKTV